MIQNAEQKKKNPWLPLNDLSERELKKNDNGTKRSI